MDIKTDWTPDDYYNIHDDLTRTEGNIHEIAAVLSAAGHPATLDEKLNWTMQDFPTDEEMNRIVGNINALRTAMNAPELPEPQLFYSEEYVTADRINDLESCIQRAYWTSVHTPPVQESGGSWRGLRPQTLLQKPPTMRQNWQRTQPPKCKKNWTTASL